MTAIYLGDENFLGSTNSGNLLINAAPIPAATTLHAWQNAAGTVSAASLLSNSADPDGDALSLTTVSPTGAQGGMVSFISGTITYTPPAGYSGTDNFVYAIVDTFGAAAVGTVTVIVHAGNMPLPSITSITQMLDGTIKLDCSGAAGQSYLIQASTNLASQSWSTLATNVAGTNGWLTFIDLNASNHPTRFYRAATP